MSQLPHRTRDSELAATVALEHETDAELIAYVLDRLKEWEQAR
jgi:hypothetical protein